MSRQYLHLGGDVQIATGVDAGGRWFQGTHSGCSMLFRDPEDLRVWVSRAVKPTSRDSLDSWLASLSRAA